MGFVEPVDDHHHAGVTLGSEDALKLRQQFVAVIAACRGRQRLTGEIHFRHPRQCPRQLACGAVAGPHAPHDPRGQPPTACPPPRPRSPSGGQQQPRPPRSSPRQRTGLKADEQGEAHDDRPCQAEERRPKALPGPVAHATAELPPPRREGLGRRLVVAGSQQAEIPRLRRREPRPGRHLAGRRIDERRHELRHTQRQDRVHVIPELPLREHLVDGPVGADPAHEPVEEGIEVVVEHDERLAFRMRLVVTIELPHHLQLERRLARPLLAKHDRGARIGRVAVDLVPGGMKRRFQAGSFEDGVVLRVFLGKRVPCNAVVLEKFLNLHGWIFTLVSVAHFAAGTRPSTILRKPSASFATVAAGP